MKIKHVLSFILVLVMAGCIGQKKKRAELGRKEKREKKTAVAKVNIPVAGNTVRSFFDEEIGEFAIPDDLETQKYPEVSAVLDSHDSCIPGEDDQEFAWVYEEDEADKELDMVYFNFDEYDIRPDQEGTVNNNINHLYELVHNAQREGNAPKIVIEGHSCKITRSNDYNFALSETRAKTIADRLIAAGIPEENIKVVGRGSEYWIVEDGSLEQQAPNRRVEIHIKSKKYARV